MILSLETSIELVPDSACAVVEGPTRVSVNETWPVSLMLVVTVRAGVSVCFVELIVSAWLLLLLDTVAILVVSVNTGVAVVWSSPSVEVETSSLSSLVRRLVSTELPPEDDGEIELSPSAVVGADVDPPL